MKMMIALPVLNLLLTAANAEDGFVDYGVGAKVAESRGVVTTETADGRCLVIANALDVGSTGYVVVTDIDSGESRQFFCPRDVPQSAPFGSIIASNGKFYTAQGKVLLEFDPAAGGWTFHGTPSAGASCYVSFTEGPDGAIWGGGYPTFLISFDPKTKEMKDHGRMDPQEMYLSSLAVDDSGWVYCGIGTSRCNIVAYNPKTGERRQIVKEEDRALGSASVYPTTDGAAFGQAGKQAYRLFEGKATRINKADAAPPREIGNIYWGQKTGLFPDGRRLVAYNMPDKWLEVENPKTKGRRRIEFDYETEGVTITSLAEGPGGMIYASTCHPMHLLKLDIEKKALLDLGAVPAIGGGNFCAIAFRGNLVIGAEYAGGRLWAYDVSKPWNPDGEKGNPVVLARWHRDICRPRTALLHPDGKHVMMAGFAGYGLCGGGLGIYNLETNEETLLTADKDLLSGHSCITLKALPNGDLVGGTSIGAPGGGRPTAKEAELFILDWRTKKVTFRTVPVSGESNIVSLQVASDGRVYGLSGNRTFFVFDPKSKKVVHSESFSGYGNVPRHALQLGPEGKLYAMLGRAILRITPGTFTHEKLANSPVKITAGGALVNGRLCFASASHVWTYKAPGL